MFQLTWSQEASSGHIDGLEEIRELLDLVLCDLDPGQVSLPVTFSVFYDGEALGVSLGCLSLISAPEPRMFQELIGRGSLILILNQALLDKVDAIFGAILEHLLFELWVLL